MSAVVASAEQLSNQLQYESDRFVGGGCNGVGGGKMRGEGASIFGSKKEDLP